MCGKFYTGGLQAESEWKKDGCTLYGNMAKHAKREVQDASVWLHLSTASAVVGDAAADPIGMMPSALQTVEYSDGMLARRYIELMKMATGACSRSIIFFSLMMGLDCISNCVVSSAECTINFNQQKAVSIRAVYLYGWA